jgi:hypothetical protein
MEETITPAARFYRLHRDEQLAKKKLEYHNRPDVIAKREERERKKAEKETERALAKLAEKAAKQAEKDRKVQERVEIAIKTKRKIKKENGLQVNNAT